MNREKYNPIDLTAEVMRGKNDIANELRMLRDERMTNNFEHAVRKEAEEYKKMLKGVPAQVGIGQPIEVEKYSKWSWGIVCFVVGCFLGIVIILGIILMGFGII